MKKALLITLTISLLLFTFSVAVFAVPASDWSWAEDAKFEVSEYIAYSVEDREITLDGELDEVYLQSTRIESYPDEEPCYMYHREEDIFHLAKGDFVAYVVVSPSGMYIYSEIEDGTIYYGLDNDAGTGDSFKIYFDWCPESNGHPSSETLYSMYELDGKGFDYLNFKNRNAVRGQQYLGWIACDYENNIKAFGGFFSYDALGPDYTDSVLLETRLTENGWALEMFVPWRDSAQKNSVIKYNEDDTKEFPEVYHSVGIGFESNDDCDIYNTSTPDYESRVKAVFDQRWEMGVVYWIDYTALSNITWKERVVNSNEVNTSDSVAAITVALVSSGAGIVVFSKKKKDR